MIMKALFGNQTCLRWLLLLLLEVVYSQPHSRGASGYELSTQNLCTRDLSKDCQCFFHQQTVVCCRFNLFDKGNATLCDLNGHHLALTGTPVNLNLINPQVGSGSLSIDRSFRAKLPFVRFEKLESFRMFGSNASHFQLCHTRSRHGRSGEKDRRGMLNCSKLDRLKILNLGHNKLERLDSFDTLPNLKELYLSGNPWLCFDNKEHKRIFSHLEWLLRFTDIFRDKNSTFCFKPNDIRKQYVIAQAQLSNFTNVRLDYFLSFRKESEAKCPSECTCHILNTNYPLSHKVLCINQNLTDLPQVLPPNTKQIDVSQNLIHSLVPLRSNPHYKHLNSLRAHENMITSMGDLIGSPFVNNNPTAMDLQENKITTFEIDLLEDIFVSVKDRYEGSLAFLFAGNPLDCGCDTLKRIQDFLYRHERFLADANYMACGEEQEDFLVSIDYESACQAEGINYMAIIVVLEVILLVLLTTKLAHDIWDYRRTGELPWLARHICLGYSYAGLRKPSCPLFGRSESTGIPGGCAASCRSTLSGSSGYGTHSSGGSKTVLHNHDSFRPRRQLPTVRNPEPPIDEVIRYADAGSEANSMLNMDV